MKYLKKTINKLTLGYIVALLLILANVQNANAQTYLKQSQKANLTFKQLAYCMVFHSVDRACYVIEYQETFPLIPIGETANGGQTTVNIVSNLLNQIPENPETYIINADIVYKVKTAELKNNVPAPTVTEPPLPVAAGAAGEKGDKGDKGDQGLPGYGFTGATGAKGDKGDQGAKGDTGSSGSNGTSVADVMTTAGDITVRNASNVTSRLAAGTSGQVLTISAGGIPTWSTALAGSGTLTSLNSLTAATQTFATGVSGADFNISSSGSTHTFNIPDAGVGARGAITTGAQTLGGNKTLANNLSVNGTSTLTGLTTMAVAPVVSAFTTNGGLIYTNGSGATAQTSAGSAGQLLQSNAGGAPTWVTPAYAASTRAVNTNALSGLTGGGNLTADRNLVLDVNNLTTVTAANNTDLIAIYDGTGTKNITRANFLGGLSSGMTYRGTWSASANTPALANGVGTTGDVYAATTAGTVNFGAGPITFAPGDFAIYNGTIWELAPSATGINSFNGRNGAVVPVAGDYTAALVTNTPSGNISATTVQAALNELDTEKLGSLNGLTVNSQTFANDTNVTITSAGSVHTLGWAGQLGVARGGTNSTAAPTAGAVSYGTGTAYAFTASGVAGQVLQSAGAGAPTWVNTTSLPVTVANSSAVNSLSTTINGVAGTSVNIINSNSIALTQAGGLVSTINGVAATQTTPSGTVTNVFGFNGAGNPVYQALSTLACDQTGTFACQNGNTLAASLTLGTNDANSLNFETNGINRLTLNTSGHLLPVADNAYDLGVATTNRFRTGYFGTSVTIGATTTITDGAITQSTSGTGNLSLVTTGGTTGNLSLATATTGVVNIATAATVLAQQSGSAQALRFNDADDSNFVGIKSPATVGSNITWILPAADGTSGQALVTDGAGNLTFATVAGGGGGGVTSFNGQTGATQTFANDTNVTLSSAGNTHTLGWSGQLAVTRGGTGLNTVTTGEMLYGSGANTYARLTAGSNGQVLTVAAGVPAWSNATSLGAITLATGTTGTDVNVSGSPATLGGTLTLNIPDAGAASRGVVTTGAQTIAGNKTLSGNTAVGGTLGVTGNQTNAGNLAVDGNTTLGNTTTDTTVINGAQTITSGTGTPISATRTISGQWVALNDGTDSFGIYNRAGSPEGFIAADKGSLAIDTNSGALYIKTTDTVNTGWSAFGISGAGLLTASNGLTAVGTDVQLGGTLATNTTIATGGFNLSLTGTGGLSTGTGATSVNGTMSVVGTSSFTGASTFATAPTVSSFTTNGGLVYTNSSGLLAQTTAGTSGQLLQSNAGGAPTWVTPNYAASTRAINTNALSGLAGGGNLTADRNLVLDVNNLTTVTSTNSTDLIAIYDGTGTKNITRANFLSGLTSGMTYRGTWSAAANSPALTNGVGTTGDIYAVTTAGTVNFGAGAITFAPGDFVTYNGTVWQYVPSATGINSFNGRNGAVVPVAGDYTATLVTNTPAGNISATTVQAALNELDTEKLGSLNGLTVNVQTFATGTTGADFNISSSGSTHTFNIPDAGTGARGLVTTTAQTIAGNKTLSGNTAVGGTLSVTGATTLTGAASLSSTLNVTGLATFTVAPTISAFATNGGLIYTNASGATAQTAAGTSGQVLQSNGTGAPTWVNTSSLGGITLATGTSGTDVNVSGSPVALGGTLTLNIPDASATARGLVTTGAQTIAGAKTFTNDLTVNAQSDVRFADADSSNFVGFQSPAAVTSNVLWTLPAADGTASQVLTTDGAGNLSWATVSGGGGTNIYNTSGSLTANRTLTNAGFALDVIGSAQTNRFDSTGMLLVNTTTTTAGKVAVFNGDVDVSGVIDPTALLFSDTTGTSSYNPATGNGYRIGVTGATQRPIYVSPLSNATDVFQVRNAANTAFFSADSTNQRIGIGTTTPANALTVKTATSSYGIEHTDGTIRLASYVGGATTAGYVGTVSNHPLVFYTNNSGALATLSTTGNFGIGDTTPASALTVGNGDLFQVNSSGNITKINNVTYSWPSSQGTSGQVLSNNGSGTLSWVAAGGASSTALSAITAATAANTISNGINQQVWRWGSLGTSFGTPQVGMTFEDLGFITSGTLFKVQSGSSGLTGDLVHFKMKNTFGAGNTGNILKIENAIATDGAVGLNIDTSASDAPAMFVNGSVVYSPGNNPGGSTDYTLDGQRDDAVLPNRAIVRFNTVNQPQIITGIAGGVDGEVILLVNGDTVAEVTLANMSSASQPQNQIYTGTGGDLELGLGEAVYVVYDVSNTRWSVVGAEITAPTSDMRLKNDILDQPLLGLEDLMKLKVHNFTWKDDSSGNIDQGFFAQELFKIFPDAVIVGSDQTYNGDKLAKPWKVDYGRLTPLLAKATQDLNVKLEDFKTAEGLVNAAQTVVNGDVATLQTKTAGLNIVTGESVFSTNVKALGKLTTEGALVVNGPSEFVGTSIFRALVTFADKVLFQGDVTFLANLIIKGKVTYEDRDVAGYAVVPSLATRVDVVFEREYSVAPIVNTTVNAASESDTLFVEDVHPVVTNVTSTGFSIVLKNAVARDVKFSWSAIAVRDAITVVAPTVVPLPTNVVGGQAAQPTPTAEPGLPAAGGPTESPSATPSQEPTSTPSITPSTLP